MTIAYDELIDFIISHGTPRDVIEFEASDTTRRRVWESIQREKESGLSPEETSELETFMHLEHIMRIGKARAVICSERNR